MPSWFDKVFSGGAGKTKTKPPEERIQMRNPILDDPEFKEEQAKPRPERAKPRRVIEPTILTDDAKAVRAGDELRIKAKPATDGRSCTIYIDRPLLDKMSAWFTSPSAAFGNSPLAESIFEVNGIESVQIHGGTILVTRDPYVKESWTDTSKEVAARIRNHFTKQAPIVTDSFLNGLPAEKDIQDKLQTVIDTEVNPSIAAHSGSISLERVEANTVFIRMMGGCQGCAASAVTLKQGIFQAFREAVPQVGAILDVTEHAAGTNPYYTSLPAGIRADA
jgi:Fe-S cluster biogenesis protein NfuA